MTSRREDLQSRVEGWTGAAGAVSRVQDIILSAPPNCERIARNNVVKYLLDPKNFVEFSKDILSNRNMLRKSAANSYVHPNGFSKIVLLRDEADRYEVRLHIWKRNEGTPHVHNHCWDFHAGVLMGAYESRRFVPSVVGSSWKHFRLQSVFREHTVQQMEDAQLQCTDRLIVRSGMAYELNREELHQVSILEDNEATASVVVRGPFLRRATDVYCKTGEPAVSTRFETMAPADVRREILDVLGRLVDT